MRTRVLCTLTQKCACGPCVVLCVHTAHVCELRECAWTPGASAQVCVCWHKCVPRREHGNSSIWHKCVCAHMGGRAEGYMSTSVPVLRPACPGPTQAPCPGVFEPLLAPRRLVCAYLTAQPGFGQGFTMLLGQLECRVAGSYPGRMPMTADPQVPLEGEGSPGPMPVRAGSPD